MTKLTIREKQAEAKEYCKGCLKFDNREGKCLAFTELYPMWGKDEECWSRVESPYAWKKSLEDIESYAVGTGMTPTQERWREFISGELMRMDKLIDLLPEDKKKINGMPSNEEIAEILYEDQRRGKGGGGEKNKDGSSFGPQQLKDNRMNHRKLNPKKWSGWHDHG